MKGTYNEKLKPIPHSRSTGRRKYGINFDIVGESCKGTCWKILFPGSKTPYTISKGFITVLPDEVQQDNPGQTI